MSALHCLAAFRIFWLSSCERLHETKSARAVSGLILIGSFFSMLDINLVSSLALPGVFTRCRIGKRLFLEVLADLTNTRYKRP